MAITYTEAKTALNAIAVRSDRNSQRVEQARTLLTTAAADLAAMPTDYAGISTDINTEAAANPDDAAWQCALDGKNAMIADFQALKATVDALVLAIEA